MSRSRVSFSVLAAGACVVALGMSQGATTAAAGASAEPQRPATGVARPDAHQFTQNPWTLHAVAIDPAGRVWAVGGDESSRFSSSALALRQAGDTWVADTPSSDNTIFNSVAAIDSDDVWAAGTDEQDRTGAPFLEHWDGQGWSLISAPAQKLPEVEIFDLAAVAPDDVYATGRAGDESGNFVPVHLHWNGRTWTNDGRIMAGVVAVSAASPDDAWAVGRTTSDGSLIRHWDGSSWTRVDSPAHVDGLIRVDAIAADDAWAIGAFGLPFIEHWDGTAWSVVPGPGDLDVGARLTDIAASSAADVWMVGGEPAGLVEHWDGSEWTRVSTLADGHPGAALTAVTVTSPTDAWIAGSWVGYRHHDTYYHPLLMHWDGLSWTLAKLPNS